jgi:hypothetical protein
MIWRLDDIVNCPEYFLNGDPIHEFLSKVSVGFYRMTRNEIRIQLMADDPAPMPTGRPKRKLSLAE